MPYYVSSSDLLRYSVDKLCSKPISDGMGPVSVFPSKNKQISRNTKEN